MQVTVKCTKSAASNVSSVHYGDEVELKSIDGQRQLCETPQGWISASRPEFAACSQISEHAETQKWRVIDPTGVRGKSKLRVGDVVSIQNKEVSKYHLKCQYDSLTCVSNHPIHTI